MLSIENLCAGYGGGDVLQGVSLEVRDGEIISLLGANGSGKTTLMNAICGFLPARGRILLDDENIIGRATHQTFNHGIVQVSQSRDLFTSLTVHENLQLGGMRRRAGVSKSDVAHRLDWVLDLFPRLAERRTQITGTLSGGEQQMLAIGRALMGFPRILLLDEPSGGLAPKFVAEIGRILHTLKDDHATVLLVEQNIGLASTVSDRFYILRSGKTVFEDDGAKLKTDAAALAQRFYL
jgi:branched-chain amino acid transport system ATP-binding protein